MSKRIFAKIYTTLLVAAFVCAEFLLLAWRGVTSTGAVCVLSGLLLAFFLAPAFHELGHVVFAKSAKMQPLYVKFFCFLVRKSRGRYEVKLVNPFLPDEAQVVPVIGGDMKNRACRYAIGGLVFNALLLALEGIVAIVVSAFDGDASLALGAIPYTCYLFLMNAAPIEVADGKTDAAIYLGIKRGELREGVLLTIMEIQGQTYAEKRFSETDEKLFNFPTLAEDDPLFIIGWDLKYLRALDEWNLPLAAECLKRMAQSEEYFAPDERQKFAAELTYLHALNGDFEKANECAALCEEFLRRDTATAKRVLGTFAGLSGEEENAEILKKSGLELLGETEIYAERKLEESLLLRINTEDLRKLKKENDYENADERN